MPAKTFDEVLKFNPCHDATGRFSGANLDDESTFSIFKTDDDKRLVFGWASISITVDGEQLEDRQQDIIDPEDLEEAAYEYVLNFRDTGEEHISTMRKKGKLVESCVLTAEKQKAMGIPEGTVPIGWWIGFKIEDDAAWERVKNGTYKMFSIEGRANREPVEKSTEQPAAKTFHDILKFNPYHDARGRFSSSNGYSSFTYAPGKSKAHDLAIQRQKQRSQEGGATSGMKAYVAQLEPDVEYPERVEYWKKQIQNGNDRPVLVSSTDENRVIDGNHTLAAYKELGKTPKVYAMDRVEFLLGASEADNTVDFIRQAIKDGKATEVKKAQPVEEVLKFNPYHDARGRFSSSSGFSSFTTTTRDPAKQHWADRAVQRQQQQFRGGGASVVQGPRMPHNMPPKPAAPTKPTKNFDRLGFADHDDADFHQLHSGRQYYQQQKLTAKQQKGVSNYLEANTEPGSLYSHSQNMNYKMANGQKLTGKYKQTHDELMSSMHNIGYNVNLTRYDHAGMVNGLLKSAGAGTDYERMSASAIKKALVGKTVNENKFLSCSYNDFSGAPASSRTVFDSRAVKINYKVKADVQAMMPGNGPGGNLGEMILAPTNGTSNRGGKITNVRLTGQMVRRKGTQTYNQPRIEIDIEI